MVNDIFTIISDSYTRLIQGDSAHEEAESILFGAKNKNAGSLRRIMF